MVWVPLKCFDSCCQRTKQIKNVEQVKSVSLSLSQMRRVRFETKGKILMFVFHKAKLCHHQHPFCPKSWATVDKFNTKSLSFRVRNYLILCFKYK